MSIMTILGWIFIIAGIFGWGFFIGENYSTHRPGGIKDLQRDVRIALREYDELLSLLSQPPVSKVGGTLHRIPVAGVERSPLTVVRGGDCA